jgi:hypothetical protein
LRFALGALIYFGFAFISPVALVAAPLGLLLAFQRPARREALLATACLTLAAWSALAPGDGFARFEGAWVCLLAGATVVAITARPPGRFALTGTALCAVALAAVMGALLIGVTSFSFGELRWLAERHFGMQSRMVLAAMRAALGEAEGAAETLQRLEDALTEIVAFAGRFFPALVLIQSLAALAAAWALYRGVARHPEGEPLPRLAEFRFSDHLVWGIVFALMVLVIPGTAALHTVGGNVATFFGALYVVRGLGIVAAIGATAGMRGAFGAIALLLATLFLLPLVVFGALGLGISDTWVDWRKMAEKARSKAG